MGLDPNDKQWWRPGWWVNPLNSQSLRLNNYAFKLLSKVGKKKFHIVELSSFISGKQFLQLQKQFTEPYYLYRTDKIAVLSEKDAIMLQLHGGDLGTYLNNLENQ